MKGGMVPFLKESNKALRKDGVVALSVLRCFDVVQWKDIPPVK